MKPRVGNQRELARLCQALRILDGWKIRLVASDKYSAQVTHDSRRNRATIYDWPGGRPQARDFILHEVLHPALRAIAAVRGKERRQAEEEFIQDLCKIYCERLAGKTRRSR